MPPSPRAPIDTTLIANTEAGFAHAGVWPVSVSGVLLPAGSFAVLFEVDTRDADRKDLQTLARSLLGFGTLDEMAQWLGLPAYPGDGSVLLPSGVSAGEPMGLAAVTTEHGPALSVSYFPLLTPTMDQSLTDASQADMVLYERAQANLSAVGAGIPEAHGLDTSLARVGLSVARRTPDAWATRDAQWEGSRRPSALDDLVAESKPAVWWTLRYKTAWLADGSIVSGNPIFTNVLWNELGRGTDLRELETWLGENGHVVDELTVAVFNTSAPRWRQVLPDYPIDQAASCAGCHGEYDKGWSEGFYGEEALTTVAVRYAAQTAPVDVGTDPQRAAGMSDFAEALNALVLSQAINMVVTVQAGYVPPPLDGIWAWFPYLHNGSFPTLCALLSPVEERPARFVVGPPDDPATDFDEACVGIPAVPPEAWLAEPRNGVDASIAGLANGGHETVVSGGDRGHVIEYLKTL